MINPIHSICKNCKHKAYCVLTLHKDQVLSCDEYFSKNA